VRRAQGAALAAFFTLLLGACATPANVQTRAQLTPVAGAYADLVRLPEPTGKIVVAVYGLRDQTGQYKPAPDSSFSTAVTQGAAAILVKALKDSRWFIPVEREGLQNVLTERRIVRAIEDPKDRGNPAIHLPPLMPAKILIEGGIVAYETNVKTGGIGVRYLGIGASELHRVDQVTVNLRAVDISTGQILSSVSTTKTVYSQQVNASAYTFVAFKKLFEFEAGYSANEPGQLAVKEAIESALIHLVVQGMRDNLWSAKDAAAMTSPIVRAYLQEAANLLPGQAVN
jgi:curli production assembly/transport component CsgG